MEYWCRLQVSMFFNFFFFYDCHTVAAAIINNQVTAAWKCCAAKWRSETSQVKKKRNTKSCLKKVISQSTLFFSFSNKQTSHRHNFYFHSSAYVHSLTLSLSVLCDGMLGRGVDGDGIFEFYCWINIDLEIQCRTENLKNVTNKFENHKNFAKNFHFYI